MHPAIQLVEFVKMHGLGNDFAVFDNREGRAPLSRTDIVRLADRFTGIGCDQLVLLQPALRSGCAALVRFFNPDGSEAGACGNGSRCVAWLLMEESASDTIDFETASGLLRASRHSGGITVDMGQPRLDWQEVPLARAADTTEVLIDVAGTSYNATCCSMGNPHATLFIDVLEQVDVAGIGAAIEHHPLFPQRVNVGFAQMLDRTSLRLAVWERGAGRTLACGTAACAAAVAAIRRDFCDRTVRVELALGHLMIEWSGTPANVLMTGPAVVNFRGNVRL